MAVSDHLGITAQPREVLGHDAPGIAALIRRVDAQIVVVGLPLDRKGEVGRQARKVLKFVDKLRPLLADGVDVQTWDERFSTAQAERSLIDGGVRRDRRTQLIDMVSAALILQSWLEAQPASNEGSGEP